MSSKHCLIAGYPSFSDARVGLEVLESAGFGPETVSVVTSNNNQELSELGIIQDQSAASPPTDKSVGAGTVIGGSVGGLLGTASLIGPFLVAGPLVGMAAGAAMGGLLGASDRWEVEQDVASDYESKVQQGHVLVIVNDEDTELQRANRLLTTTSPATLEQYKVRSVD